jgi:hypothetical protein
MTQDEIIALLEKAKLGATGSFGFLVFKTVGLKELTDFANLVAAKEREALAQTQEPDDIASILACRDMLDAQPVPPRTWVGSGDLEDSNAYLTPPQRTWVGLTDEEQQHTYEQWQNDGWGVFYNAIEAKLKQKNGFAEEKNT